MEKQHRFLSSPALNSKEATDNPVPKQYIASENWKGLGTEKNKNWNFKRLVISIASH